MSLKVYTAYKVKYPECFWDLVEGIRKQGKEEVRQRLYALVIELQTSVDTNSEEYRKHRVAGKSEETTRLILSCELVKTLYKEQVFNLGRNTFNLDVSIVFHELDGQIYLIPYCDLFSKMAGSLDFLEKSPLLTDFRCWDNGDRPAGISQKQWNLRAQVWNELHIRGWGSRCLTLTILDYNNFWMVSPYANLTHFCNGMVGKGT